MTGRYVYGDRMRPKDQNFFSYKKQSMHCTQCRATTVHELKKGRWTCIACGTRK